ncbi:hypothetical protein [Streptomyces antarcticus]|uniref:hypothetical protein n=1 Tax=Streptomyces antarcticus TaxID=2996458 RepID=UPI002271071A|nr:MULTISPECIES: hypothetical protein [unclassified Streptomyces]MCY0943025.1 hypothetical protein [Streptomyces sp. H34-AA3]MCY0949795.1 hypothetical protein [Streptomyces sp. H27-S2]MCZ4086331.1 hypothetical protein [Streptomyces sp. H34-S5]
MNRCMATLAGTAAAAAALALSAPGTAYAAHGILIVDGVSHREPVGCFPLGDFVPPVVSNYTASAVAVWSGPDCSGRVEHFVDPGETYRPNGNRSVFVS